MTSSHLDDARDRRRRDARHNGPRRHISSDDGTGGTDRAVTDADTRRHPCVRTDMRSLANRNWNTPREAKPPIAGCVTREDTCAADNRGLIVDADQMTECAVKVHIRASVHVLPI